MNNIFRTDEKYYPEIGNFLMLLFCGYVLIWYLQIGYRIPVLGSIRFEFIFAASMAAIAIFTNRLKGIINPLKKNIVLFVFCIAIQIPLSYDFDTSWNVFLDRVVKFSFMAIFIVAYVKSPRALCFFLAAFLIACMKMGQEGLVGHLTGGLVWENQGVPRLHGATPIYQHPNSFAGMALGAIPFIYYLFTISPNWLRIAFILQFLFSMNIIIFSGSRTGYVAFISCVLYILYKTKRKTVYFVCLIFIGLLVIQIVPNDYIDRFYSIYTGEEKEGKSSELRKQILEDGFRIFMNHPFGVGVGAFPAVRKMTFGEGRVQDTHNLYLEIATNLGIQGFIVFCLLIIQIIQTLNKIINSTNDQIDQIRQKIKMGKFTDESKRHVDDLEIINATSSAVIMFLVIRLSLGLFGMDLYEIYWWFALGLTISLYNIDSTAKKITDRIIKNYDAF